MSQDTIFQPMLVLMLLTAIVWVYLYAKRIPAMRRAGVPAQVYTTRERVVERLPEAISYPANNFKNLFELPVLFYVLCLYLFVTASVDAVYVGAAWAFVMLRAAHSAVHCTINIVMLRFGLYLAASLALWFMLVRALASAF